MSIYRRTDRVSLNDVTVDRESRPSVSPAQTADWSKRRTTEPANGLLRPTAAWASTLPSEVQPRSLMYKFPRIANLLAAMWPDPNSFRRYIDDLLVDKRGSRQGFPVEVLRELFELRAHYDSLHPATSMPWEVMSKKE
ncbi:MAG: hypothetical protein ABI724_12915 [Betaproteobacteria bacterium]